MLISLVGISSLWTPSWFRENKCMQNIKIGCFFAWKHASFKQNDVEQGACKYRPDTITIDRIYKWAVGLYVLSVCRQLKGFNFHDIRNVKLNMLLILKGFRCSERKVVSRSSCSPLVPVLYVRKWCSGWENRREQVLSIFGQRKMDKKSSDVSLKIWWWSKPRPAYHEEIYKHRSARAAGLYNGKMNSRKNNEFGSSSVAF